MLIINWFKKMASCTVLITGIIMFTKSLYQAHKQDHIIVLADHDSLFNIETQPNGALPCKLVC